MDLFLYIFELIKEEARTLVPKTPFESWIQQPFTRNVSRFVVPTNSENQWDHLEENMSTLNCREFEKLDMFFPALTYLGLTF